MFLVVVIRRPRVLRWCSRCAALRRQFDFHMGMAWTAGFAWIHWLRDGAKDDY